MRTLIYIAILLANFSSNTDASNAELVLTNGKLFIDGQISNDKDSIAIKDGKILSVFKRDQIDQYRSKSTQVIDVEQDLIIPGIIDAHMHTVMSLANVETINLGKMNPTKAEVSEAIVSAVKQYPQGSLLYLSIGENIIDDASINAKFLDQFAPHNPVWLATYYGHGDIMNSLAMKAFNIQETLEENSGGFYQRDANNQLTGKLYEYAHWVPKATMINQLSDKAVIDILKSKAKAAVELGITGWHDMPMLEFNRYLALLQQANLPIRVTAIPMQHISVAKDGPTPKPQNISQTIRVLGEKWILDGTPIERGAALSVDYADKPGWQGRMNFSQDAIKKILDGIIARQSQALFHIAGDKTLDSLLSEMEKRDYDWSQLRVRIEHADGINASLIKRSKNLGIVIVQNPSHFMNKAVGTDRIPSKLPFMLFKTLVDSDIPVAIGSDGPMNPFLNIMFARIHQVRPEQGIDVATSLQLYTKGSAYAGKQERELGQIKQGMKADLAVLTQNILEVPLDKLPQTQSKLTIINGKIVYQRQQ